MEISILDSCLLILFLAEKFRFSAEFIEMRRAALDIFVNRIALHPELQQSEDLRTFLQADEEVGYLDFTLLLHHLHIKMLVECFFFFPTGRTAICILEGSCL